MTVLRWLAPAVSLAWIAGVGLASSSMLAACGRPEQAPAVSYTLLDGRKADLASLRGRVVLVNFWATDCAPCVAEMPALVETWRRFSPQGFETLAVSMSYDAPLAVSNFAQSRRLPFEVVIDNTGEIAARFGDVRYTPTNVLINKRGEIVRRWIGAIDPAELQGQIAKLLAET
jgi:peroxiredoxin